MPPRKPNLPHAAVRSDRAYHGIRQLIVAGRLSPGARLVEADLAARFGVSRGAIRPALLRLRQEGLATAPRGARQARLIVAPLTRTDAAELYLLLGEIEGLAAAKAATLPTEEHHELIQELRDIQAGLDDLRGHDEPDAEAFLAGDRSFHQAIVTAGGGARVASMYDSLRPQLERYSRIYAIDVREHLESASQEHRTIITRIEDRDPEGSHDAVRRNWRRGAERLARLVERMGARGDWHEAGPATDDV